MKKIFLIILGLSICLFLASCFASETINDTSSDSTNSMPSADIMYFDSFHHMAQLKEYRENVDDTDDDIVWYEYVTKNYRGGFKGKKAVSQMFANLDGLNMLLLDNSSGYNLSSSITYRGPRYYGCGYIEYVYTNEDKKIRIKCYVDPDGTVASEFAESKQEVADKIAFGGEEVVLYSTASESTISFRCCVNTSNSLIDIWFYDDDINAAKEVIEKYAISTTLNELIA